MEFLGINTSEALIIALIALIIVGPASMISVAKNVITMRNWWVKLRSNALESLSLASDTPHSVQAVSQALGMEELRKELDELRQQLSASTPSQS